MSNIIQFERNLIEKDTKSFPLTPHVDVDREWMVFGSNTEFSLIENIRFEPNKRPSSGTYRVIVTNPIHTNCRWCRKPLQLVWMGIWNMPERVDDLLTFFGCIWLSMRCIWDASVCLRVLVVFALLCSSWWRFDEIFFGLWRWLAILQWYRAEIWSDSRKNEPFEPLRFAIHFTWTDRPLESSYIMTLNRCIQ